MSLHTGLLMIKGDGFSLPSIFEHFDYAANEAPHKAGTLEAAGDYVKSHHSHAPEKNYL
ncbi:hypothetical protein ONV78_16725 [Hahella sp. CR1]|uniref:hypothetical protein n=1 Tax=Hahella sp. CR1 TaxID=2992807 RepID=UPI002440EE0B|nr:hypothetical protein [Hahella sp. CR1]MDG9669387.1 hypothetical protein [Hahella sp. CR1]